MVAAFQRRSSAQKRTTAYELGAVSVGIGLLIVVSSFFIPERHGDDGSLLGFVPTATGQSTGFAFSGQF